MYYLETIPFTILVITLIELAIRKPKKADAISNIICEAAFVNLSTRRSELSYSMLLILEPAAIIFVPISVSLDARPVSLTILIVSLVDSSFCICVDSLAMTLIIKQLTLVFRSISVNNESFDLDILYPFS
jgi:hypothetical protein